MITEAKHDHSFPASRFLLQVSCTPFRLDQNKNGGRVLLYIRNHITSTTIIKNQIETFFVEIKIRISIWLPCCSYNLNKL